MPATRQQRLRVLARTWLPWRKLLGNRTVRRTVQGVPLYMPWSHVLPDYARARATYGQNLIELAAALAAREPGDSAPLRVLDVGANIGDSALQILNRVDARVLCVEADPYWIRFLHLNVDPEERITVEEVLLVPDDGEGGSVRAIRQLGTTSFAPAADADGTSGRLSARALKERHPDFAGLRLIKSDTDGYDAMLVPALAREWDDSGPVLFFEFEPRLARQVGNDDPGALWADLAALGYERLAIWDNTGDPLGQLRIDQVAEQARVLDPTPDHLGYQFWDVAACRAGDRAAGDAFDELMPEGFDPRGHRRSAAN
jgi:FkbM family methyltransferase